ncbi:oligosaccharide flippase family protein [Nocardioides sp. QY071]|uniref:oligosaccharide flippase family protein n=1 Tax=Nocardioides sp. QY071 TaxID=3044187 RepID=UPI00249C00B1|nr:oligosaccharide flippase family protein [Nocardioides sp. QY071]WGX99880.1 oligosaccharide flippase family protein [Nocardioides sp. QY071]
MTTTSRPAGSRISRLLRSSAGIAIAMAVMNVGTYGFQIVSARLLGPGQYGALAGVMALLLVLSVLQLGLQATSARRIAADPEHVAAVEAAVLRTGWRLALVLGAVTVLAAPLVTKLLRLDGLLPAVLLGLAIVPATVMGAQAGVLQGERRWLPLSLVYLAVGVPRVILGIGFLLVWRSESSAMLAVLVSTWIPVLVGAWALGRHPRRESSVTETEIRRDVLRETLGSSIALLAFFAMANLDIVVARSILGEHDAGLYAGGLIVTKAVLFLPQFAVVVLFPSMSTGGESRAAVIKGLAFLGSLGALGVAATYLLPGLAIIFVGGADYAEVQDRLWMFAVLGALLSLLQLLVYAGLATRGVATKYVVGIGVLLLIGLGATASSVTGLATRVGAVDLAVLLVLVALQVVRHRRDDEVTPAPAS